MNTTYPQFSVRTILTGSEAFPRHSEASILELHDGGLLLAWQCYGGSDASIADEAPSTIALMNSRDNGVTWQNHRIAVNIAEGCVNCYSPTLFQRQDGSISLFFMRYTQLEEGKPALCNFYRIDSFDEGNTWTEEHILWKNRPMHPINHALKRLADGSVVMPLEYCEKGYFTPEENYSIVVMRSDDDCRTWTQSVPISAPMRGLMEPCIAQYTDGSLQMVMRTQLGSVFYSKSFDGGRSWSKPQTTGLRAPESCSCVVSVPGSDAHLVVWNNSEYDMHYRSHYGKRTPLTVAVSRDGLKTFSDYFDIETDSSRAFTNPAVTVTASGLFCLTYWTCPYYPDGRMGDGYIDLKLATFRVSL